MNLISLDPKVLDNALAAIKPAVGTRSAVQAFSGVRVHGVDGAVALYATNMETSVRKHIQTAVVHGEVDVLVSHGELHRVAKLFKGKPVTLTADGDSGATITNGPRTVTLPGLRSADWPKLDFSGDYWLTLDARTIAPILERATMFATRDETRPILTGVRIEPEDDGVRLTATDSYRLVTTLVAGATGKDHAATVPAAMLRMLARSLKNESDEVRVYHHDSTGSVGERTIWSLPDASEMWMARSIDGKYPNHRQLIPEAGAYTATVVVPRTAMLEAVTAADALAVRNMPVRLGVNGQFDVTLRGVDSPSLHETIDGARITHKPNHAAVGADPAEFFEYGVNPGFLRDTIKASSGDEVTFHFISPLRPVLITEPGTDFLVMPIRLNV